MNRSGYMLYFFFLIFLPFNVYSAEYDTKYIFFEHWRHFEGQGIACEHCHQALDNGAYSLPGHAVCESCHTISKARGYHKDEVKPACAECHPKDNEQAVSLLSTISRKGKRIFYHSAKIEHLCYVCHGKMVNDDVKMGALMTSPDERIRIRQKSHYFHSKKECNNCHREYNPAKAPENHKGDWGTSHAYVAPRFNCKLCHTKSFCQNCHESVY